VKGEYLYVDLGHASETFATPNGYAEFTTKAKVKANIVRVGVDYRF
jgi:opacity protein-like surface antigen